MRVWEDPPWQGEMALRWDWSFFDPTVVGEEHGVGDGDIERYIPAAEHAWHSLMGERERGGLAFWNILGDERILEEVTRVGRELKGRAFRHILVLGIGGSALGTTAIFRALAHPFHNIVTEPHLFVLDNIDPTTFSALLDVLDANRTLVIVVSKSGTTAETMSQFLIVRAWMSRLLGERALRDRIVAITDPEKGILRAIARRMDLLSCAVPPALGGRFSVLSAVGLLPSFLIGVDVEEMWQGARYMAKRCEVFDPFDNPVCKNALYHFIFDCEKRKSIHVYWAYADGLYPFADWLRQLIAESLGKKREDGSAVGVTPVKALGATDQHSQLQLYREGPHDKVVTFLGVERWSSEVEIPTAPMEEEALAYLGGHHLGELLHAEQQATSWALAEAKRPNMTLWFPRLNAFTLGEAFFAYELQTAFMGALYGINPFDQPGVELSKAMTYGIMGRKGFEEFAAMGERFGRWKK